MRNFAAALLFLTGSTIACNSTTIDAIGGLTFAASAAPLAPSTGAVQTDVVVTNATRDVADVSYTCPVHTLFRTGSASGPIVFDSRGQACNSGATTIQIDAGSSATLSGVSTPGLPSGTYFVTAILTINGTTTAIDAGQITL